MREPEGKDSDKARGYWSHEKLSGTLARHSVGNGILDQRTIVNGCRLEQFVQ